MADAPDAAAPRAPAPSAFVECVASAKSADAQNLQHPAASRKKGADRFWLSVAPPGPLGGMPAGSAPGHAAARLARSLLGDADMSELSVDRFMTHCPHTIGHDQPLSAAREMMRVYGIRHLPVLRDGMLAGMLSQRDLHLIEALSEVDPEKVPVSDAMSTETFAVGPRASLRRVAAEMADHRYGSAVIVERDKVIGILTTVDGMRILSLQLGRTPNGRSDSLSRRG